MNAPLIPQANPGAAFRSRRDALLKAAARVKEDRTDSGIDVDNGMNFDSYYAGKEISYFGYPSPDGEGHSGTDEHLRL